MDSTGSITSFFFYGLMAVVISLIAGYMAYVLISRRKTVPSGKWEGFQGPSMGVSDISCGQESSDAVALSDLFANKQSSTSEGPSDLKEFKFILSKLCCMKHDLVSPSQVLDSTMKLPFANSHDRELVANTVARCFTKSVPMRDLDISFGTWKDRGYELLNKLCTSYNLTNEESERARGFFKACWMDTFIVAKQLCGTPDGKDTVNPREIKGRTPESIEALGTYGGYY